MSLRVSTSKSLMPACSGLMYSGVPIICANRVKTVFSVSSDFPRITLVSMVAPSPDWFAGVRGLALLDGETWVEELVVPLYPYDAGTDSGISYTAADVATVPPAPTLGGSSPW